MTKELLLSYRRKLSLILDASTGKQEDYHRGVATVVRTLLFDFDTIFFPKILQMTKKELAPLIKKYCYTDGCPICGKHLKRNTNHSFYCADKKCFGELDKELNVIVNDKLRMWLADKERECLEIEANQKTKRFANLDI